VQALGADLLPAQRPEQGVDRRADGLQIGQRLRPQDRKRLWSEKNSWPGVTLPAWPEVAMVSPLRRAAIASSTSMTVFHLVAWRLRRSRPARFMQGIPDGRYPHAL
jgi:hypothetical protein